jgi:4-amino-4-deoxy-L-arabinose transferase-like glycosyltransferase
VKLSHHDVTEAPARELRVATRGLGRWRFAAGERLEQLRSVPYLAALLALVALALGLATQFAYSRDLDLLPHLWLGFAIAAGIFGMAAVATPGRADDAGAGFTISRRTEILALIAIMAVTIFFRAFRFFEFPPGIWFDEGVIATDAIYLLEEEHFAVWRDTNFGRATLYPYMVAASFKLFGFTLFALRIVPVVAGIAAVFAFYFLARSIAGPVPALAATALLAVSRWATTFSRVSWDPALVPLFAILSVLFFVRAVQTRPDEQPLRHYGFFALAGASLAAGLYSHPSFRVVPIVMAVFVLYVLVREWRMLWKRRIGMVVYAATFAIVLAPLAHFALFNQDKFLERTRTVSVFREVENQESWDPLRNNVRANFRMMNVAGDRNGRHNLPGEPMLDDVTAVWFVLGFAVSFWSIRSWRRGAIWPWYVLALVPGALTITFENPSAIRVIGAIPPIYLMAALSIAVFYRALIPYRGGSVVFLVLVGSLLVLSGGFNYHTFFERQAKNQHVHDGFTPEYRHVGEVIARQADRSDVYVSAQFRGHPAVRTLGHQKDVALYMPSTNLLFPTTGRDVVLIPAERQLGIVPMLRQLYPNLHVDERMSPHDEVLFASVTIPSGDIDSLRNLPLSVEPHGSGVSSHPQATRLDEEWTAEDTRDGPVNATWDAFYWASPEQGDAAFSFTAPGPISVEIAGERYESRDGVLTIPRVTLIPGEHPIRVLATIVEAGKVSGEIATLGGQPLAAEDVLYGRSVGDHGFRVAYRSGIDFAAEPFAFSYLPAALPADRFRDGRAIEMQGILDVEVEGEYEFAHDGGNRGQIYVDGALVVDNSGSPSPSRAEGSMYLTPGERLISIRYVISESPNWALYLRAPGGDWLRADGSEFRPPTGDYSPPPLIEFEVDATWVEEQPLEFPEVGPILSVDVTNDGALLVASEQSLGFVGQDGEVLRVVHLPSVGRISDIAVAASGEIAVADSANAQLLILTRDGEILHAVGPLQSVVGVGADSDHFYVVGPSGGTMNTVRIRDGRVEPPPLSGASADERPRQPSDIAVSKDGTLYIADFERRTIVASEDGETVALSFPGAGGTGESIPRLATHRGYVFLSDPLGQRIVAYDRNGRQRGTYVFPPTHDGIRPLGIAITADGLLYAADREAGVVYRFRLHFPEDAP